MLGRTLWIFFFVGALAFIFTGIAPHYFSKNSALYYAIFVFWLFLIFSELLIFLGGIIQRSKREKKKRNKEILPGKLLIPLVVSLLGMISSAVVFSLFFKKDIIIFIFCSFYFTFLFFGISCFRWKKSKTGKDVLL